MDDGLDGCISPSTSTDSLGLENLENELSNIATTVQTYSAELTPEQTSVLQAFKELLEKEKSKMTPMQQYYCFGTKPGQDTVDNSMLIRYLKARDWDIPKAHKLLTGSLQWYEQTKPYQLSAKEIMKFANGSIFCNGFDKQNRPLVFMVPRAVSSYKDIPSHMKLLIYTLESSIHKMSNGVEQMTWVLDFQECKRKNIPPLQVCKQTLDILSSHFPERLGLALIIFPPAIFSMFFSLVSPFIPPVTKSKIRICKSHKVEDVKNFLEPFVDLTQLEKRYGGSSDETYSHDKFWNSELEWDEKRKKKYEGLVKFD
ncbi:hypothetical protein ABK040_008866 [Willaertia magna]